MGLPEKREDQDQSRDGEAYRPHWDRWAAQEDEFIARHRPRECADLIAVLTAHGFEFCAPG